MFERFTHRARTTLVLAQDEARTLSHRAIEPEHLLLGLLREGEGVAAVVLSQSGVSLDATRQYVASIRPPDPEAAEGGLPFSPTAKKVLELSLREALRLGHNYIGTEHILLALIRQSDAARLSWLREALGVEPDRVKAAIEEAIHTGRGAGAELVTLSSPALNTVMSKARACRQLEKGPLTTSHLLRALFEDERSLAAIALSRLGVTREAVERELEQIDIEETTDATVPPDPAEIRIGNNWSVKIDDPTVVSRLRDLTPDEVQAFLRRAVNDPSARRRGPPRT